MSHHATAARLCTTCHTARAQILRPKDHTRLCSACFTALFEHEIYNTITTHSLFTPGERVAIGASGGKDSSVLAAVLCTLNARHNWNLDLVLLSIDEGIKGYRDHSLEAVKRHSEQLGLELRIVSYADLYGWSMDEVVRQIGKKGNCTYCGVFRRQALDRGARSLGVKHVVTGHNADDAAETVVMNLLRGDMGRLKRGAGVVTGDGERAQGDGDGWDVKRSKPLMFAYEKEIVLYAHHKGLDYFSTECIYSPEAFRGSARTLIKNLERIRPESILDIVKSGMDVARLVPEGKAVWGRDTGEKEGGCENANGTASGDGMAEMEKKLTEDEEAEEKGMETEVKVKKTDGKTSKVLPTRSKPVQKLGQCQRCGYLSSQTICKACVLLEGLNKARPHTEIEVDSAAG